MLDLIPLPRRRFLLPLGSVCALCVGWATPAPAQDAPPDAPPVDPDEPQVEVTDYGVVDLAVQDADLAQVLQMLSMQARKNIITSKNVEATVTATLYDVTFQEALDAILTVNGFGYVERGNFIYVYTQEELEALEAAERQTEPRLFELEYLSGEDAAEFVAPLLSEAGTVAFRGIVDAGIQPDLADVGADDYAYAPKLVVNDFPENLERIASLLAELDTPPMQVLVESTIVQTAVDESTAMGLDFSALGSVDFTDVTQPLNVVNDFLAGANGFQPADNDAFGAQTALGDVGGPGGLKIGVISDDVAVFLRLLDEVTDTTILARPKVMALNRQRAEILVGARIGYLSTLATETTTTQTIEYLDTGIQLVFRPFINRDGMIRLELHPSVSEASLRNVTNAEGAGVTIPDQLTNEVTTNVRVRDGETLILGGLFRESTSVTRRQVPILGDVPVVGLAFRGQEDSVQLDEIIFLITPSIVRDDVLWDAGDEALALSDAVRIGARKELLPFSRTRLTTNYNQLAIEAREAGDVDLALYHIANSLRLNPNQPQIVALRQELTGVEEKAFEQSLLQRVLDGELERLDAEIEDVDASEPAEPLALADPLVDPVGDAVPTATDDAADLHEAAPADPASELPAAAVTDGFESAGTDEAFDPTLDDVAVEEVAVGLDDEVPSVEEDDPFLSLEDPVDEAIADGSGGDAEAFDEAAPESDPAGLHSGVGEGGNDVVTQMDEDGRPRSFIGFPGFHGSLWYLPTNWSDLAAAWRTAPAGTPYAELENPEATTDEAPKSDEEIAEVPTGEGDPR